MTQAIYTGLVFDGENSWSYHFGMTPLAKLFERRKLTPTSAAAMLNQRIKQPEIYRWVKGERPITRRGAELLAPLLQSTPESLMFMDRRVPIVGNVGADSAVHYEPEKLGLAPFPHNGNESTVALKVRGDALGAASNGWLIYYDDRRDPPTPDLIGKLCVVRLDSGQVLVKRLFSSRTNGCFDLWPAVAGNPITDQHVHWAACVTVQIQPEESDIEDGQGQ